MAVVKVVQAQPDLEQLREVAEGARRDEEEASKRFDAANAEYDGAVERRFEAETLYWSAVTKRQNAERMLTNANLPTCDYCPSKLYTEQEQKKGLCKWCQVS